MLVVMLRLHRLSLKHTGASLKDEERKLLLKVLDGIRHGNIRAWDPVRHRKMWLAANGGVAPEQSYLRDSERIFTEKTRRGQ